MGADPEPRTGASSGPGVKLEAGCLMVGYFRQVGDIVTVERSGAGTKPRAKTKEKELFCLPNGLAELLDESF